jgi:hypothetical protein
VAIGIEEVDRLEQLVIGRANNVDAFGFKSEGVVRVTFSLVFRSNSRGEAPLISLGSFGSPELGPGPLSLGEYSLRR